MKKACLEEHDLTASVHVATQIEKAGIQGIIFPSVVKGGDDNLIVYLATATTAHSRSRTNTSLLKKQRRWYRSESHDGFARDFNSAYLVAEKQQDKPPSSRRR